MSFQRTFVSALRTSQRWLAFSTMARQAGASSSPACKKFVSALEDYREKNYGQCLHSRFVRDMIAATDINGDGMISRSELSRLLHNIGAEQRLTNEDLQAMVDELGEGEAKQIPNDCVENLILRGQLD